jgi:uncharacterized membrane protein
MQRIAQASLVVVLHLAAAVLAFALGTVVVLRRKGTRPHRWLGRTWAALMLYVAVGSFWIQTGGRLSWIHLLSALTIVGIGHAIWAIRRGDIRRHRRSMLFSYAGLCAAGAFALLPQRLIGHLVFG